MIATLRQPRWVAFAAVTVLMCVLFWWLGTWQWHRWEDRRARNQAVEQALAQSPAPLGAVMPDAGALPAGSEHRRVTVTGEYDAAAQVLQRNPDGRSGYAVLTPLLLDHGGTLVVDRGFVPPSPTDAAAPATDVTPPSGPMAVTVRLRAPETASGRTGPDGQVYEVVPDAIADGLPGPVYAAYGELVEQQPPPDPDLELPPAVSTWMGPHLFYAIQWWLFIGVAVVGYVVLLRRETADRRGSDSPAPDTRSLPSGDYPRA